MPLYSHYRSYIPIIPPFSKVKSSSTETRPSKRWHAGTCSWKRSWPRCNESLAKQRRRQNFPSSNGINHDEWWIYIFIYLSIVLYIHTSIYLSIYPSIHLSFHLSIYPSIQLSIYTYFYPSIYLSIHPSVHPSIHLSIHLSIYPTIYASIQLSI